MSLLLLPPELFLEILEDLSLQSRASVCALALTCKYIHLLAVRSFYSSVTDSDSAIHDGFLHTIQNNPTLAQLVRVYHAPTSEHHCDKREFLSPTQFHIGLMTNLQELTLSDVISLPRPSSNGQDMPHQLQRFTMWPDCTTHEAVKDFLETQLELTHLRWGGPHELALSRKACPNLRCLDADITTAKIILPGRCIEGLHLRDGPQLQLSNDLGRCLRDLLRLKEFRNLGAISFGKHVSHGFQLLGSGVGVAPFEGVKDLTIWSKYFLESCDSSIWLNYFPCTKRILLIEPKEPSPAFLNMSVPVLFRGRPDLRFVDVFWRHPTALRWIKGASEPESVTTVEGWVL